MESMESMEEQMAFNGMITAETKSGFSLQNATVNVSTLLMMFGMAMTVMIARCCFWKMYGEDVGKESDMNYGTISMANTL